MNKYKQKDYLTPIKANLYKLELNKPYKFIDMCRILEVGKPNSKHSKTAMLKVLDSLVVRVEGEKKKHIITAIRSEQLEIVNMRGKNPNSRNNNKPKEYDNLKINKEHFNSKGIYGIFLNNECYIGKTEAGFRQRFVQHKSNSNGIMPHTQELLGRGGEFKALHIMNDICDPELFLIVEDMFIDMYKELGYKMLNNINTYKTKKPKKPKYKSVKVKESDLEKLIQLAKENNIDLIGINKEAA